MKKAILFAALLFIAAPAAAELDVDVEPIFVLSTERHEGTPYDRAVVLVAPYKGGHVGLVLNRPTGVALHALFPDFEPARKVVDPVYFGGEFMGSAIFALVKSEAHPSERSTSMSPGVWLVEDEPTIDRIIEATPNQARYYVGRVHWLPGMLRGFLDKGLLTAMPADAAKLFLPDTSKLYQDLAPAGPRPAGAKSVRSGDGVFDLAWRL